jgi:Zn finger protein HypA/HybF involved in hydrogenase expression
VAIERESEEAQSKPFPPSKLFVDAVTHSGSCEELCELCGRTCFEADEFSHDEGRLDELRELEKKEPDKYVEVDQVRWGDLDGKHVVTTCPCNGLRPYENFIWNNRHIIAKFVQQRTERIAEAAYSDEAEAEFLEENVSRQDADKSFKKCQDCGGYFCEETMDARLFCPRCAERNGDIARIEQERIRREHEDDDNFPF